MLGSGNRESAVNTQQKDSLRHCVIAQMLEALTQTVRWQERSHYQRTCIARDAKKKKYKKVTLQEAQGQLWRRACSISQSNVARRIRRMMVAIIVSTYLRYLGLWQGFE